jgi:hypothetical protein
VGARLAEIDSLRFRAASQDTHAIEVCACAHTHSGLLCACAHTHSGVRMHTHSGLLVADGDRRAREAEDVPRRWQQSAHASER